MSTPQIKLTYFGIPGRAELSRLIFTFGGVTFEDVRVTGPEFGAMKPTLPLGQLPVLEVDGVVYSQSMAIARYAAKLAGLYPADAVKALAAEMASETLVDLVSTVVEIVFRTSDPDAKAEKTAKFLAEGLPKQLAALEKMVQGAYFTGDNASFADVQLFDVVQNGVMVISPEFTLAAYPKLAAAFEAVKTNANVAAYLSK